MTRERLPPGTIMQKAYGVLDRYKISRTFIQRTEQEGCAIAASEINAAQGWVSEASQSVETGAAKSAGPVLEDRVDVEKQPEVEAEIPSAIVQQEEEPSKKPLEVAEHILKKAEPETAVKKEQKPKDQSKSKTKHAV